MYLPLILFLISFIGISLMIGRKLALIRNGQVVKKIEHSHPFVRELQKIKRLTFKSAQRFGYAAFFVTFKFFIKSSNFIKTKSVLFIKELKNKLKRKNGTNPNGETEKKEVSKYLRAISEYRQKIRKIKHRIKEEEGIE